MRELIDRLLDADGGQPHHARAAFVQENKFFANLAGTSTTQQRVRILPQLHARSTSATAGFSTMRTLAAAGRSRLGVPDRHRLGLRRRDRRAAGAAGRARRRAQSVEPGRYDLVVDPTNLWLTIHESIAHATELDRALGYEAAYAGTSFATVDQLGSLQYGSDGMIVTGDRITEHGLSTIGWDDEGVAAQEFDIISDGHPGRLPAGPADGRAARPGPLQRLRLRRLARTHPAAADAERLAAARPDGPEHGGADLVGGPRHLRARRQLLVDRHAAVQLPVHRTALLPRSRTAGWPASCATSPTRRPPPTSGGRWRRWAGPRPTTSAAPSTAARVNPGRSRRSRTAPRSALFRGVNILNTLAEGEAEPMSRAGRSCVERALAVGDAARASRT